MTFEEKREIEERVGGSCPFLSPEQVESIDSVEYEKMLISVRDNIDKIIEMGNCEDDDDI